MSQNMRKMYYIDGSTVRVVDAPQRKRRTSQSAQSERRARQSAQPERRVRQSAQPERRVNPRREDERREAMRRANARQERAYRETPARREDPRHISEQERERRRRANAQKRRNQYVSPQADRALAFDARYTAYVVFAVAIMMAACFVMLISGTKITSQQQNVANLEAELNSIRDDNTAYKIKLENMYSLDDVYDIATNELGMVYAKKGQVVYYDSTNEDYVKQYQNVPEGE